MKHIYKLLLVALTAFSLQSCADAGPEPLFDLDISFTPVSVSPYTASFKLEGKFPEHLDYISPYAISEGRSIDSYTMNEDGTFEFRNLEPNTTYRLEFHIALDGNVYGYDNDDFYYNPNYTFTTKAEGDFSDFSTNLTVINNYASSAMLQIVLPDFLRYENRENIVIKYGTTPDLSGSDTRTILYKYSSYDFESHFYSNDEDIYGVFEERNYYDELTGNYIEGFLAQLFGLKSETTYYLAVEGDFYYYDDRETLSHTTISCGQFKTSSEPMPIPDGLYFTCESSTRTNRINIRIEGGTLINTDDDPAIVYCSTEPELDIATAQKVSLHKDETVYGYQYYYADFTNLTPGATYNVWVKGKFRGQYYDYTYGTLYYEYDGLIYPQEGYGSFHVDGVPPGTAENGSEEAPYTPDQVLALGSPGTTAWVAGYIVGTYNSHDNGFEPDLPTSTGSNIAIAATPGERDGTKVIPVQLVSGTSARDALYLWDNPEMLGRKVMVFGSLEKYFGVNGIKNVSNYKIVE